VATQGDDKLHVVDPFGRSIALIRRALLTHGVDPFEC